MTGSVSYYERLLSCLAAEADFHPPSIRGTSYPPPLSRVRDVSRLLAQQGPLKIPHDAATASMFTQYFASSLPPGFIWDWTRRCPPAWLLHFFSSFEHTQYIRCHRFCRSGEWRASIKKMGGGGGH